MSDADLDFLRQLSERQQQQPLRAEGGSRASRSGRGRRRKKSRKGRRLAPIIAVLFLVGVIGGVGYAGYSKLNSIMNPPDYSGDGTGAVTVWIHDGDTVSAMARRLEQAGVIKSVSAFMKIAKSDVRATSIQPGYYHLRLHMSSKSVLALLLSPASRIGRLTLPEGKRVADVLPILAKKTGIPLKEFQQAAKNTAALGLPAYAQGRLEGYLYPFTYDPGPKATATQVLRQMVDQFKRVAAEVDLENGARALKMSPHDVVTIASLVQAESGTQNDMPKIARVIDNRLHNPQPYLHRLQLDSTVLYGLHKKGIVASATDIKSATPYNTYNRYGLPPGAIDNPGEVALRAVLAPADGPWIYFVATDPAHHVTRFTASYAEFLKFRQELLRNLGHG